MVRNPFATREVRTDPERADVPIYEAPEYVVPQHGAYAAPSLNEGSPYNDEYGWGPKLHTSTVETPAAQRTGDIPRFDRYPEPTKPPQASLYGRLDVDVSRRHSVEDVDADGWTELKGLLPSDRRWAPNPRSTPPAEPRPTSSMAPRTYTFTRPFDTGYARTFNGVHFSMADHRRTYEILGMRPATSRRNTYRMEPPPWDLNVVDLPPEDNNMPDARIRSVELPPATRSFRLV